MGDNTLIKSSFSATIHAPIEKVDIPGWCFNLTESEYQACSQAHVPPERPQRQTVGVCPSMLRSSEIQMSLRREES